ncbi:MAG: hypothetical protein ABIA21_03715 [Candidatus Aenigmatarchaeota archaeon]
MNERISDYGTRSVMEFFQPFHLSRMQYPFIYYCRTCIRNFETKQRVPICPRCKRDNVVELPKNWVKVNKLDYVDVSFKTIKQKFSSFKKRLFYFLKPAKLEEMPSVI